MKGDTKVMSSSPPNKNHKRTICTIANHKVMEGSLQATQMGEPEQRLRQQLCCSLLHWRSSHSSEVQVPAAKLSLWAGCFARLISTLGVAGGWNCLNRGVAKTGTSEQISDSQLFVIISSGMTTWEKAPFNSGLWQSSSNEFRHSGLRHPLYLAVHPDSRGLQLHPSYPAHGTGS